MTSPTSQEEKLTPSMNPEDWSLVSQLAGNGHCIDCRAQHPEWASVNFGILFCTRCSSGHRSLCSVSRVRSLRMDAWTELQVARMKVGGNQRCREWFSVHGISATAPPKTKYDNDTAKLYTQVLQARVEGRPEPTSLQQQLTKCRQSKSLLQRIHKICSDPDFWLSLYAMAMVGWCAFFVAYYFQQYLYGTS